VFVSFSPFLRHISRKYFQMKNSILVAVCSLAGVCASSAQAGYILMALPISISSKPGKPGKPPSIEIEYQQSFGYSSGVSVGEYVVLSLAPGHTDPDIDPVDIYAYNSSGTLISGVWSYVRNSDGMSFTMTALQASTGYFTFIEPNEVVSQYSVYSSIGGLIESGSLDITTATSTTAAVSTPTYTPAPGAVALLGLAGVFGARRRRN